MSYVLKDGFVEFPHLGVPHGVSTRAGGVSEGPYASMNLGRYSGDDVEKVHQNRRLFGQRLGIDVPYTLQMTHGTEVAVLRDFTEVSQAGDACITDHPRVSMSLTTADCVPVLFADPIRKVVGLAHAGWKGTASNIVAATLEAMRREFGCSPADVRAAVGPAIRPCCFLVREDVQQPFAATLPEVVAPHGEQWTVDLQEANRLQLVAAGVPEAAVAVCDLCTSCRGDLFFSYRRDQKLTGRMAAAIAWSA